MKKYGTCGIYGGNSVAARIAYAEKMGVDRAIAEMIKDLARKRDSLDNFYISHSNGFKELRIIANLPYPTSVYDVFERSFPTFSISEGFGVIDKLCVDSASVQFHTLLIQDDELVETRWHTVREAFDLQKTCLLYEFVDDIINDITLTTDI